MAGPIAAKNIKIIYLEHLWISGANIIYLPMAVKTFLAFVMLRWFRTINQSLRNPVDMDTIHMRR